MVNGKLKTVRTKVAQFYGVYDNVTRMMRSGSEGEDCTQLTLIEYLAEYGILFTLIHCKKELRDCQKFMHMELSKFKAYKEEANKKYKSSGNSSSFKTQLDASFNLNTEAGGNKEEDVQEIQRPKGRDRAQKKVLASSASSASGNENALARLCKKTQTQ
ncbi:hypothetical protein Tco_0996834 [Tanacetum coccineum]